MRRSLRVATCCAVVALAGVGRGCGTPGGQRIVFPLVSNGVTWFGRTHIDEITEVGAPLSINRSDQAVRLVSMQLAGMPSSVHVREVDAYSTRGLPFGVFPYYLGDLTAECPEYFGHPQPVSAITVAPHAQVNWIISIVFTISRPGVYYFRRMKITYMSGGARYWQYQNLHGTLHVIPPPEPGLRPLPTSAVC